VPHEPPAFLRQLPCISYSIFAATSLRATRATATAAQNASIPSPQLTQNWVSTAVVVSIKAALDFSLALGGRQVQSATTAQNHRNQAQSASCSDLNSSLSLSSLIAGLQQRSRI